jgi:hypothetical protein
MKTTMLTLALLASAFVSACGGGSPSPTPQQAFCDVFDHELYARRGPQHTIIREIADQDVDFNAWAAVTAKLTVLAAPLPATQSGMTLVQRGVKQLDYGAVQAGVRQLYPVCHPGQHVESGERRGDANLPQVTRYLYDTLQLGMTLDAVRDRLHADGTEVTSVTVGDTTQVTYRWTGTKGGFMIGTFEQTARRRQLVLTAKSEVSLQ